MQFEYTITNEDRKKILKTNFYNKNFFFVLFFGSLLFAFLTNINFVTFDFNNTVFINEIILILRNWIFYLIFYLFIIFFTLRNVLNNSQDEQVEFIFSEDKFILNTNLLKQEFLYNFFDTYLIYGEILKLKKFNHAGVKVLLYKLTDSQNEELISIISSKIPLKK